MKTVVVLGAGYAGLSFLKHLSASAFKKAHFVLVNEYDFHYKTTQLHKLAASENTAVIKSLSATLPKQVKFVQAKVLKILPDRLTSTVGDIVYDELIIAAGASSNPFDITGLHKALEIGDYAHAKECKERLDALASGAKVAILGAGFSGCELAGSLANTKDFKIDLVEAMDEILPMYAKSLAKKARIKLEKAGVNILSSHKIRALENGKTLKCLLNEQMVEKDYDAVIFTAGVRGSALLEDSFISAKGRRVAVNEYLQAPEFSNIWVIGDCAAFLAPNGRPFAPTAQIAALMGKYLAKCFNERDDYSASFKPSCGFSYFDKGSVCSLGAKDAVGFVCGVEFSGFLATMLKNFTDLKWDIALI